MATKMKVTRPGLKALFGARGATMAAGEVMPVIKSLLEKAGLKADYLATRGIRSTEDAWDNFAVWLVKNEGGTGEQWITTLKPAVEIEEEAPAGPAEADIATAKKRWEDAEKFAKDAAPSMKAVADQLAAIAKKEYEGLSGAKAASTRPERPIIGANTKFVDVKTQSDFNVQMPAALAKMIAESGYMEFQTFQKKDNGTPVTDREGKPVYVRRWMGYRVPVPGHGEMNIAYYTGDKRQEHLAENLVRTHPGTWYPCDEEGDIPGINLYDADVLDEATVHGLTLTDAGFATTDVVRGPKQGLKALGANGGKGTGKKGLSALGG